MSFCLSNSLLFACIYLPEFYSRLAFMLAICRLKTKLVCSLFWPWCGLPFLFCKLVSCCCAVFAELLLLFAFIIHTFGDSFWWNVMLLLYVVMFLLAVWKCGQGRVYQCLSISSCWLGRWPKVRSLGWETKACRLWHGECHVHGVQAISIIACCIKLCRVCICLRL